LSISGTDLLTIGFPQSPAIGKALEIAGAHLHNQNPAEILRYFQAIIEDPRAYLNDPVSGTLAELLLPKDPLIKLKDPDRYTIYGVEHIEEGAREQMDAAMRLPVSVAGALMPDAHQGYGLPIGGVLAADNAVIPYGVGVDIGCRMCLTIFDLPETELTLNHSRFKRELTAQTKFGAGGEFQRNAQTDHRVLDHPAFRTNPVVKKLYDKAVAQLGTSGSGNHFVEWGTIDVIDDGGIADAPRGKYVALLSHSGSRGIGATIANHYTKLAKDVCRLPKELANLAFLDLDSDEGAGYWEAMTLAGDYASACHEIIHSKMTRAIGANTLGRIENHHNFAWKEKHNGRDVIVHRKGATPAGKDVLGVIPGSMTAPGYIVRGKGNTESINSASHGAGRRMSRKQASLKFTHEDLKAVLADAGVTLIGGGLDESPGAYKDISVVMKAQQELVDVIGVFTPKIVVMDR
jgi:tRNA-splicing ligase RtcB